MNNNITDFFVSILVKESMNNQKIKYLELAMDIDVGSSSLRFDALDEILDFMGIPEDSTKYSRDWIFDGWFRITNSFGIVSNKEFKLNVKKFLIWVTEENEKFNK